MRLRTLGITLFAGIMGMALSGCGSMCGPGKVVEEAPPPPAVVQPPPQRTPPPVQPAPPPKKDRN